MGLRGLDLDKWTFSSTALVVAVVFGLFPLVSKLVQKNHHRGKVLVRAAHRDGATPVADSRARGAVVPLPTLPGGWGVWDAGGALRELSADDCSQISLAGRRLLVLDFVDEQMASGTKALKMAMQMAITTNRTLVEPATGSLSANSNYHRVCPGPRRLAQGQRLGALYDLGQMRTAGLLIMDLEEYWALDRCGLLPVATVLPGSAAVNGSCMRCGPNGNGTTVFTFQHFGRLHAGNRAICAGTPEHALWRDMVSSDTPVLEACCVRKLDGASVSSSIRCHAPVTFTLFFIAFFGTVAGRGALLERRMDLESARAFRVQHAAGLRRPVHRFTRTV